LYLKPGSLLFWEKTDDEDLIYGHVAIVVSANNFQVTIAQQNRYPPIQTYKTAELIELINSDDSQFLGIKVIPQNLSEFLSYKLKNIQIKHVDS
jgi:surface antigen